VSLSDRTVSSAPRFTLSMGEIEDMRGGERLCREGVQVFHDSVDVLLRFSGNPATASFEIAGAPVIGGESRFDISSIPVEQHGQVPRTTHHVLSRIIEIRDAEILCR